MNQKVRVLHFSNGVARGGAEEHMLTLLRNLDRDHFELLLACPPALREQLGDLPDDVEVTPWAPMEPWQTATGWRLARWMRRRRVQLLHAHLSCASRAAAPWAKLAGVPVLETPHVRESWRRGWKRSCGLDRAAGLLVDAYIAVSHANARYLREEKRLPAHKVHTILNGIAVARFAAPVPAVLDPRPALGIPPADLLLLCVARLEPQKGHAVLLEALAALPRTLIGRLRLVCLGEGGLLEPLRRQAAELALGNRVVFTGFDPQVERWLAVTDLFVLPSRYEGLPLSAMEASAAGCPVLATAVDGTPEVVAHGRNGWLVPPGDAPALTRGLLRLLTDTELRRQLGEGGRHRARREFDQIRQTEATAALYCELAGVGSSAAAPGAVVSPEMHRRSA
ncbi:MAG: glycosyltransferase [Terriglobales bacterium]